MRVLIIFLLLISVSANADILFLNDGSELRGRVTKIDDKMVALQKDGKETEHALATVLKVQVLSEKRLEGEDSVEQIHDPRLRKYIKEPPKAADFPGAGHIVLFHETKHELLSDGSSTQVVHEAKLLLKERDWGRQMSSFPFEHPMKKERSSGPVPFTRARFTISTTHQ